MADWHDPERAVLDALERARSRTRRSPRGYLASCPCPDHGRGRGDRNPSLSVMLTSKGVHLNCFAGCHRDQVLAALGLQIFDLFHDRPQTRARVEGIDRDRPYMRGEARLAFPVQATVYDTIERFAFFEPKAWPSQALIARLTGYSLRTVSAAVRWLVDHDWLEIVEQRWSKRTGWLHNVYRLKLTWDSPFRLKLLRVLDRLRFPYLPVVNPSRLLPEPLSTQRVLSRSDIDHETAMPDCLTRAGPP